MSILVFAAALAVSPAPIAPPPSAQVTQSAPAKPVDPVALASAKKLLGMMHLDQTIDRMMASLIPVIAPAILGTLEHNEATQAAFQKMESQPGGRERLMAIFSEEFLKSFRARYPAIIDGAAQEYATVFTAQELDQAIAFYGTGTGTGTGAKFLALSPQLQQAVGARAGRIGQEAGMEAGYHAMQRAVQEMLPTEKTSS